jgi:hypothetical protein
LVLQSGYPWEVEWMLRSDLLWESQLGEQASAPELVMESAPELVMGSAPELVMESAPEWEIGWVSVLVRS